MKSKCLLIVDTSPFGREVLKKVFGSTYNIQFALGPQEPGLKGASARPDAVLYQMRAPSVRNLEHLFGSLSERKWHIPVVVVSSSGSLPLERYARSQGVFFWMTSPYNLQELWDVVEAAVSTEEWAPAV
jgi:DNA-binding NtrC family response regulator